MEGERVGSAAGPSRRRDVPPGSRSRNPYDRKPLHAAFDSEIEPADGPITASPSPAVNTSPKPPGFLRAVAWAVTPLKEYFTKVTSADLAPGEARGNQRLGCN